MIYFLLFNAIALSITAEYYAIMGLMAIFSGSPIAIAIMGGTLGLSKILITSWLYRNWKQTSILLKVYFSIAVCILMLLTSMGIFGYLSKAHLDQGVVSGDVTAAVALIDEKINIQKENINAARKTISQLDSQVDAALSRTTDAAGADRSTAIRRSQAKERVKLIEEISTAQKEIAKLNEQRAPIAVELRKVEAEVGPIKYIAAFIYEDSADQNSLEKAVRWLIVLIVLVFDPLAVLMFIAVNQTLAQQKPQKEETIIKEVIDAVPNNDMEFNSGIRVDDQITIEKW
jgi:hypothetical protein